MVDHPYVIALLQNNNLEIHSLVTQEIVQVVQLIISNLPRPSSLPSSPTSTYFTSPEQDGFQPRSLVSCSAGFPSRKALSDGSYGMVTPLFVPQAGGSNMADKVYVRLQLHSPSQDQVVHADEQLEPPSTPKKRATSSLSATKPSTLRHVSPVATTVAVNTLIWGKDSVLALCPLTLVAQADALMANNRIEDALSLLQAVGPPNTSEQISEFCYVKQKAAWTCLFETRFLEASLLFYEGRTDPRLLIRLFPDLYGKMFSTFTEQEIHIFKGLQTLLGETELDQISIEGISQSFSLPELFLRRRLL